MIAMQTLRVHRPRVIIHGPFGMGQAYIGATALHYLEGYHVQSIELGTLMGDSTRFFACVLDIESLSDVVYRPSKLLLSNFLSKLNEIKLLLSMFLP